jgi:hypothetical protein
MGHELAKLVVLGTLARKFIYSDVISSFHNFLLTEVSVLVAVAGTNIDL